jgi:hypothetical protein
MEVSMSEFSVFIPAYERTVYVALRGGGTGEAKQIAEELPPRLTRKEAQADLDVLAAEMGDEAPANRFVIQHVFKGDGQDFEDQVAAAQLSVKNRAPLILLGEAVPREIKRHRLS